MITAADEINSGNETAISLRDRFAMAALSGLLGGVVLDLDRPCTWIDEENAAVAGRAYDLADRMLHARTEEAAGARAVVKAKWRLENKIYVEPTR